MQPINLEAILPHLWISGRSSRAEWWRVHIICAVLAVMLEHIMFAQLAPRPGTTGMQPISLLWPIASLTLAWVSFASVVRRSHDRGKSGWWALLYFVPGIGWLWILIECGFLPGKAAPASAARAPMFTPASAPSRPAPKPALASRSAARLQATPRVGTIQRVEHPSWDGKRALKLASRAVSIGLAAAAAFMLYKIGLDPNPEIFTELSTNESLPVFQKP
jgi:uncharacterized membrane protein YhaH (DUF805 family)